MVSLFEGGALKTSCDTLSLKVPCSNRKWEAIPSVPRVYTVQGLGTWDTFVNYFLYSAHSEPGF